MVNVFDYIRATFINLINRVKSWWQKTMNDDDDALIKLGALGVGLYILYKILSPNEPNKEIYRCYNCNGVIVGKPDSCRWCHVEFNWG